MDLFLSILLKPLVLFVLFVGVVMPISWALSKVIPIGRWKAVLFDEDLFKRHPGAALLAVMVSYFLIFGFVEFLTY